MADVYVIFRRRLPISARLNAQNWEISIHTGMKSGYLTIVAAPQHGMGKFYILTSGKTHEVEEDLQRGFRVEGGTPQRGFVTALRRAGLAILVSERLPPLNRFG